MSQACPFTTRPTHAIILLNVPNEHPIQALQPAGKPNNHFFFISFFPLLMPQMMSARPRKGMVEIHPTSESTTELVHKNQDEVWMGRGAREGFLSFTAGKCAVTGARPTLQQLPALHPATLHFTGDWMHRAVPTATWQFPGLREWWVNTSAPRNFKTLNV